jgi:hypothetical protein
MREPVTTTSWMVVSAAYVGIEEPAAALLSSA